MEDLNKIGFCNEVGPKDDVSKSHTKWKEVIKSSESGHWDSLKENVGHLEKEVGVTIW